MIIIVKNTIDVFRLCDLKLEENFKVEQTFDEKFFFTTLIKYTFEVLVLIKNHIFEKCLSCLSDVNSEIVTHSFCIKIFVVENCFARHELND